MGPANTSNEFAAKEYFCPFCGRKIIADNIKAVEAGTDKEYLFVHDYVPYPFFIDPSYYVHIIH